MSRAVYPKYKESGVAWLGEVPEHWEVKRGRFAMRVNPSSPVLRSLDAEREISFVPMEAVGEYGGLRLEQTRSIAEVGSGYTEFQDSDVVFAKITPCFENGKGALVTGLVNGAAYGTTELHVLRAGTHLDERYIFYLTITDGFRKFGEAEMYGAGGQKRVPPEFCKNFPTPLPSPDEQTRIADFLDRETGRIDTLVAKKRALIGLLKEKRSALISRTVTRGLPAEVAREFGLEPHVRFKNSGIEWLGEVPEGWEVKALSRVTISIRNGTSANQVDDAEHTVPVTRIESISGGKINLEKVGQVEWTPTIESYRLKKGDILLSHINSLSMIGNCAIYDSVFPLFSGMNLLRIQPEPTVHAHWLWRVLSSDGIRKEISSRAKPAINQASVTTTQIKALQLPVPLLPEQTAIAAYLDRETAKIDRLVEKVEAAIERLREYRTALITAAVTGKIDVREEVS